MGYGRDPFAKRGLVWIDLELTGLEIEKDTIVEIAVIITDHRLQNKVEGPNLVIRTDPDKLSPWCTETFTQNGLIKAMQESTCTAREAQEQVLHFIKKHIPDAGVGILAGSSVHVDRLWLLKYMPQITDHLHYRIVDVSGMYVLSRSWCPWVFREEEAKGEGSSSDGKQADSSGGGRQVEEVDALETVQESKRADDLVEEQNDLSDGGFPSCSEHDGDGLVGHRALYDIRQSIETLRFLKEHVFVSEGSFVKRVKAPKPLLMPTKKKSNKTKNCRKH